MKKAIIYISIVICSFTACKSKTNQIGIQAIVSEKDSITANEGAVGDVKYSVLPPDKFVEKNGKGWVLMNDSIPLKGSLLGDEGIHQLPDARGMFIRGLNLTRSDDKADPFKNENANHDERGLGEYQEDAFRVHNHQIMVSYDLNIVSALGWSAQKWGNYGEASPVYAERHPNTLSESKLFAQNRGGNETRPKNIALYVYIKIN